MHVHARDRRSCTRLLGMVTGTATGIDPDFANALATIAGVFSLGQSGQSQSHPPLPPPSNEKLMKCTALFLIAWLILSHIKFG